MYALLVHIWHVRNRFDEILEARCDTMRTRPLRAGLGPEAEEEQPREGGSLDLEGRECLACSIVSPAQGVQLEGGEVEGGGMWSRKRRSGGTPARSAAAAGRRGRSELYLVLDAKAFLLATPDRCVHL